MSFDELLNRTYTKGPRQCFINNSMNVINTQICDFVREAKNPKPQSCWLLSISSIISEIFPNRFPPALTKQIASSDKWAIQMGTNHTKAYRKWTSQNKNRCQNNCDNARRLGITNKLVKYWVSSKQFPESITRPSHHRSFHWFEFQFAWIKFRAF